MSGTIDLNEFQQLFSYINQWKGVFQNFDKDRSGKIEQAELMQGNFLPSEDFFSSLQYTILSAAAYLRHTA